MQQLLSWNLSTFCTQLEASHFQPSSGSPPTVSHNHCVETRITIHIKSKSQHLFHQWKRQLVVLFTSVVLWCNQYDAWVCRSRQVSYSVCTELQTLLRQQSLTGNTLWSHNSSIPTQTESGPCYPTAQFKQNHNFSHNNENGEEQDFTYSHSHSPPRLE